MENNTSPNNKIRGTFFFRKGGETPYCGKVNGNIVWMTEAEFKNVVQNADKKIRESISHATGIEIGYQAEAGRTNL